jgi:hypothetical protein
MTQPTDKRFVMEPRLDSEVVVLNDAIDLKVNLTDARLTDTRTPTDNSVTSAKIVDGTIVDADINAAAAIAVSKLAPIPLDALSDVVISGVVDKQTLQYELSSLSWKNKVASGGVTATDTKPVSAINGDAWLDTNDGTLYVYYTDVNTSQWIQVVANSALEGTILARLGSLESGALAVDPRLDALEAKAPGTSGQPWVTAAGIVTATSGTTVITFPVGRFTQAPIVQFTSSWITASGGNPAGWPFIPYPSGPTTSQVGVSLTNSSGNAAVHWIAIQMTSTSAAG